MPGFDGTQHSAAGHFIAFVPDPRYQQPLLVGLGFVLCARTNLASTPVHTWEAHVTAVMWRQRSRMVREKSRYKGRYIGIVGIKVVLAVCRAAADQGKCGCRLAFSSLLPPSLQLLCRKI